MNSHNASESATEQATPEYVPPPMRVFEIAYVNKERDNTRFSSHVYDTSTGALIFLDEAWVNGRIRLYYRKTIAAGQWHDVTEVTSDASARVN